MNEDKPVLFFKSQPITSFPPFVSNRQQSFTLIDENRTIAQVFQIELAEDHSVASKSRF